VAACTGDQPSPPPARLDEAVVWETEIRLEESRAVINVGPRVVWRADGSLLIADEQETQFRHYAADGRLITAFGGRGEGPGEFEQGFLHVVPLAAGMSLGIDGGGRFARFDSLGTLAGTGRLPVVSVMDADAVGDSALVLVGRRTDGDVPGRIHLWHFALERVVASFFELPPLRSILAPVSLNAGARGLLITLGLRDTVFVVSPAGERLATLPVPSDYLRRFVEPVGQPPRDWFQTFSVIRDGFWLADGSMLIQYFDFGPDNNSATFSLVRMHADGRKLFELRDTPMLLAVDARGERLLFVAPGSLTPNVLRVARLRL
jgi:hypothetical protein